MAGDRQQQDSQPPSLRSAVRTTEAKRLSGTFSTEEESGRLTAASPVDASLSRQTSQSQLDLQAVTMTTTERLPLPSPETMRAYGEFAPTIIGFARREQHARVEDKRRQRRLQERQQLMELEAMRDRHKAARRGQWMAFAVFMAALVGAIFLAGNGATTLAGILMGGTVATVVGLFLAQRAAARPSSE